MENPRKKSNWADVSDEEGWSEPEEEKKAAPPPRVPPPGPHPSIPSQLTLPATLLLGNLPYNLQQPSEIVHFLELTPSEEQEILLEMISRNNYFQGKATIEVHSLAVACKILGFAGKLFRERILNVEVKTFHTNRCRGYNTRYSKEKVTPKLPHTSKPTGNFYNEKGKIAIPPHRNKAAGSPPQARKSPFCDARPVDTHAKDIEFERCRNSSESEDCRPQRKYTRKDRNWSQSSTEAREKVWVPQQQSVDRGTWKAKHNGAASTKSSSEGPRQYSRKRK